MGESAIDSRALAEESWWQTWVPVGAQAPTEDLEPPEDVDDDGDEEEEEEEEEPGAAPPSLGGLAGWLRLMSWLAADVFRHARLRAVALLGLTVGGVSARAATLATVVLYVDAQTKGKPPVVLGTELPSAPTAEIALLWALAALCFALLAAGAMFVADTLVFNTARRYVESMMREVVADLAEGRLGRVREGEPMPGGKEVASLLHGSVVRIIRSITFILGCLVPAVTLLAAVGVMLWLSGVLSAVLIPVLLLYGVPLAMMNRMVLRDAHERETVRVLARKDVWNLVVTLGHTRFPRKSLPSWIRGYPRTSHTNTNLDLYRRMILSRKRVINLRDAFEGLSLLTVLLVFGALVGGGKASWGVFLSFILALRYATMSVGEISKYVVGLNRFVPQIQRFVAFRVGRRELLDEPLSAPAKARLPLRLEAPDAAVPGSQASLDVGAGDVLLCAYPRFLTSHKLGDFCRALAGGDASQALAIEGQTFFIGRFAAPPNRTVRELLSVRQAKDPEIEARVRSFLERCGMWDAYQERIGSIDEKMEPPLGIELWYALRLLPGALSKRRIFVLLWDTLAMIDEEPRRRLLDAVSDRARLLVAEGPCPVAPAVASQTLVVGDDRILGMGPPAWYEATVKPVVERVAAEDWVTKPA